MRYSLVTLRYSTCKYTVTLKPGLGVTQVTEDDTIQSGTHDFLLTSNSNHRPIRTVSEINGDFRRKSHENRQFFPTTCVLMTPLKGFPLELGIDAGVREN